MTSRFCIPFEELEVGQSVEKIFSIKREDILSFSDEIGDLHSFHVLQSAAHEVGFEDIIVHGVHLLAFVSRVIGENLPGFGTLYLSQEVKFLQSVEPDSEILVRIEVLEKREKRRVLLRTDIYDSQKKNCIMEGVGVVKTLR